MCVRARARTRECLQYLLVGWYGHLRGEMAASSAKSSRLSWKHRREPHTVGRPSDVAMLVGTGVIMGSSRVSSSSSGFAFDMSATAVGLRVDSSPSHPAAFSSIPLCATAADSGSTEGTDEAGGADPDPEPDPEPFPELSISAVGMGSGASRVLTQVSSQTLSSSTMLFMAITVTPLLGVFNSHGPVGARATATDMPPSASESRIESRSPSRSWRDWF